MRTSDWCSVLKAKVLLIGENSTLQWKDEVIEYAMFLDYYFKAPPSDLGERSRYSEAGNVFQYLDYITAGVCKPQYVYGTLLSNDALKRPPRGKHIYVPEREAKDGVRYIMSILKENPTIEYVFAMGLQTNYYLQRLEFYNCGELTEQFVKGAEPRRVGLSSYDRFYQPVNAKPFREVCFKAYDVKGFKGVKVIPILPAKSYPLRDSELVNFGDSLEALRLSFAAKIEKIEKAAKAAKIEKGDD